jgi:hypothetical protein
MRGGAFVGSPEKELVFLAAALQRLTRDIFLYFKLPIDAKPSE